MTTLQSKTKTVDWHQLASDALRDLQADIKANPDPDWKSPEPAMYARVEKFFSGLLAAGIDKFDVPHFSPGPNGEILLRWECDKGTLDIAFEGDKIHGYTNLGVKEKAYGLARVIHITKGFASGANYS